MCKFCERKPVINEEFNAFFIFENCETLVAGEGAYEEIGIGVDKNGNLLLIAFGMNQSDYYYPKFCPECGRKLQEPKNAINKNGIWIGE